VLQVTSEEQQVEKQMRANLALVGAKLELVWGSSMYHMDDLEMPIRSIPNVFTQFRTKVGEDLLSHFRPSICIVFRANRPHRALPPTG
jgi:deoxyribodipyrimidine photolyase